MLSSRAFVRIEQCSYVLCCVIYFFSVRESSPRHFLVKVSICSYCDTIYFLILISVALLLVYCLSLLTMLDGFMTIWGRHSTQQHCWGPSAEVLWLTFRWLSFVSLSSTATRIRQQQATTTTARSLWEIKFYGDKTHQNNDERIKTRKFKVKTSNDS